MPRPAIEPAVPSRNEATGHRALPPTLAANRRIETIRCEGLVPYTDALRRQVERRNAVESGQATNALFLLEHTPVITLGRNAQLDHLLRSRDELARMGIDCVETDRGGDVTYHGPGQLVAYPILNLAFWRKAVRWHLRSLEEVLILLLGDYGLKAERIEGFTGVWVGGAKVAAIGVGIHNWVTFHGLALNLAPNISHFGLIVPCGLHGKPVTSLKALLEKPPSMQELSIALERRLREFFAEYAHEEDRDGG